MRKTYFYTNKNNLPGPTDQVKPQTSLQIFKVTGFWNPTVFEKCSRARKIVIPQMVTNIPPHAFNNCPLLEDVTNNSTVLFNWWVRHHDYHGQTLAQMTSINLGEFRNSKGQLFTKINDYAFFGCNRLRHIIIPNSINSIGKNAFKNCSATIQYQVFNQNNLKALINSGVNAAQITLIEDNLIIHASKIIGLTDQGKQASEIIIPKIVREIGDFAFKDCRSLRKVVITENVQTIGRWAFFGCHQLENVTFTGNYLTFGKDVFFNTNHKINFYTTSKLLSQSLRDIHVNYQQIMLSDGNFIIQGNRLIGLTPSGKSAPSLIIPDDINEIADHTFDGCANLIQVHLPKDLIKIGDYAFNACSALVNIVIPDAVNQIGASAFSKCNALKNITFTSASKLVDIGHNAFNGCGSLTQIEIPHHIKQINHGTFQNCPSLTEIKFMCHLHSISTHAFVNVSPKIKYYVVNEVMKKALIALHVPTNMIFILERYFVFSGTSLISLTTLGKQQKVLIIPGWVTNIAPNAFEFCPNLEKVTIPDSVTFIGQNAFQQCHDKVLYYTTSDAVKKCLLSSGSQIKPAQLRHPYLVVDPTGTPIIGG